MIQVIDKFLNVEDLNILSSSINSDSFPWYYLNHKVIPGDGHSQFTHTFYNDFNPTSGYFNSLILPFINKLKSSSIKRIKANMTLKNNKIIKYKFHNDFKDKNMKTGIFYVNTNNGKTFFKNGKEIDSIKNRMIIFPSNLEHAGTSNTDIENRIVINFNWF
tara:strand:- start:932 stop:1414 length:483 start_codon:yes stop_codon:yes gene_type:complete